MSKLAHSSDEHMEQIERDSYQRDGDHDGLSLAVAAACRSGALQQASNLAYGTIPGEWPIEGGDPEADATTREGFATDLLEALEAHHAWLMANDAQGYVGSALHARTVALLTPSAGRQLEPVR